MEKLKSYGLSLMQVDESDISPSDKWGPLLLLTLPFINGGVALVSLPAAASVVRPGLDPLVLLIIGLAGAYVMFTIEMLVVTWSPSPPKWLGAIEADNPGAGPHTPAPLFSWWPFKRTKYAIPPTPGFWAKLVNFLPRFAMTIAVAMFVGGGVNLALNAASINYEKQIIQDKAAQAAQQSHAQTLDQDYNAAIAKLEATQTSQATTLKTATDSVEPARQRYMCNAGTAADRSKCDVKVGEGVDKADAYNAFQAATKARQAAQEALDATTKQLTELRNLGLPSTRGDAPPASATPPEGLAVTLAAFENYVEREGLNFFTAHFAEIFLGVIDLVPVTLKLLSGSPAYEQNRWIRQSRGIVDARHELRAHMWFQAKAYQSLDSPAASNYVTAAATRVVKLMSQRWVASEQARTVRALNVARPHPGPGAPQPPGSQQPPGAQPGPTVTEDPPWVDDPTDGSSLDEDRRATFVLQDELWAVGPRIAPKGWAQEGTQVCLAARVIDSSGPAPGKFIPEQDCMAVKLASDVTRLQREFKLGGELDENGCVHARCEVHLDDQVDDLIGFPAGLGYKYYPLTDAERYFSALQSGRLRDSENTYFRLTEWTKILAEVLRGLEVKNRAHDDVKPRNMLVGGGSETASGETPPPRIFLIDWDNVYSYGSPYPEPRCTRQYRAPELFMGKATPNFATDLYSLGASMFDLAVGQTPYEIVVAQDQSLKNDPPRLMRAFLQFDARQRLQAAGAPSTFVELVDVMLQADPKYRPDSSTIATLINQALTDVSMKQATVRLTTSHERTATVEPSLWGPTIVSFLRNCGHAVPDWMAQA